MRLGNTRGILYLRPVIRQCDKQLDAGFLSRSNYLVEVCDIDDRGAIRRKLLECRRLISGAILRETAGDSGGVLVVESPRAEDLQPGIFGSSQAGFNVGLGLNA